MPCGSRSRRNRRNRNRKRFQQPISPPKDSPNKDQEANERCSETEKAIEENDTIQNAENSVNRLENGDDLAEAEINGNAVKVTTESLTDALPCQDNMSISRWRPKRNRFKLEKKVFVTGTKICEIKTISNSCLEAKLDHISGVGIVESGQPKSMDSSTTMTVSEPLEPVNPLPNNVANKVRTLGAQNFALAILAGKGNNLEIHEVSDSDIEIDNSRQAIVVEAESDVEKDLFGERSNSEDSSTEKQNDEDDIVKQTMSQEDEEKLRNFIESLRLPSSLDSIREDDISDSQKLESGIVAQRKVKKRSLLESFCSQAQESKRFLDVIQEEGDKLSEDDEQHIRDFINEEIGKYRREDDNCRKRQKVDDKEENTCDLRVQKHLRFEEPIEMISVTDDKGVETKYFVKDQVITPPQVMISANQNLKSSKESTSAEELKQNIPNGNPKSNTSNTSDEKIKSPSIESRESQQIKPFPRLNNCDSNSSSPKQATNSFHHQKDSFLSYRQQSSHDAKYHRPCQIFTSIIQDNIVNSMYGTKHPPTPPKRTVSFGSEIESHRPPTPPEIDYPCELPEIPLLPNRHDKFRGPPPIPPVRIKPTPALHDKPFFTSDSSYPQKYFCQNQLLWNKTSIPNQQKPFSSDHHDRVLHAYKSNDLLEGKTVEFVRTLLTVLSNHETTRQDVQGVLSRFDLMQLPQNIRDIIDDLMAPSLSASSESVSVTDLCNDGKFGSDASLEIAHDNEQDATLEKFSEFTHSTTPSLNINIQPSEPEKCFFKKNCDTELQSHSSQEDQFQPQNLDGKYKKNDLFHKDKQLFSSTSKELEKSSVTFDGTHRLSKTLKNVSYEVKTEESNKKKQTTHTCFENKHSKETIDSQKMTSCDSANQQKMLDLTLTLNNIEKSESLTDFQGQDSSSSSATPSTAKYNPKRSLDIASDIEVEEEKKGVDGKKSPQPKRKLNLLKNSENFKDSKEVESPEPIPYSPVEDLYFLQIQDKEGDREHQNKKSENQPECLKDLCIKKILSMPYGIQIINEITLPKFNIFKNIHNIQESVSTTVESSISLQKDKVDAKNILSKKTLSETKEMQRQRPMTWVGVPTSQNPNLLVCLSPSQLKTEIKTDADKLLDLHTKYLNRRSYHENQPQTVSPLKYKLDPKPTIALDSDPKPIIALDSQRDQRHWNGDSKDSAHGNRLLNIIKENPVPHPTKIANLNDSQDRLKVTRLSDWLNLARRDSADISQWAKTGASGELFLEKSRENKHESSDKEFNLIPGSSNNTRSKVGGTLRPEMKNEPINNNEFRDKSDKKICEDGIGRKYEESSHYVNSTSTCGTNPLRKSAISMNSAIINKTPSLLDSKKTPASSKKSIDPKQNVNPALIDDRPQVPPKFKKSVTVDRSCIDTTSIFDKEPPKCHLESRKYQDMSNVKEMTATEIMENLKHLQTIMKDQLDGRRRFSLPREYFDKQLRYIELLESQLRGVPTEEQEKCVNRKDPVNVNESVFKVEESSTKKPEDDCITPKESWHEEERQLDKNKSDITKKEGSCESSRRVTSRDGVCMEKKMKSKEESHKVFFEESKLSQESLKEDETSIQEQVIRRLEPGRRNLKLERPKSTASAIPINGEVFRKKMYDEYLHKVLEREERKHHKVIKISSHCDLQKTNKSGEGTMITVEKEFIEKAKNRMNKFGIHLDDSDSEAFSAAEQNVKKEDDELTKARCLVDGKEVKDAKSLPKHLQEFLQLSVKVPDEENEGESHHLEDCCVLVVFDCWHCLTSCPIFHLALDFALLLFMT